jgi:lipopolysaccharide transport system permease protein
LNPLVGVVEGFRWAALGTSNPPVLASTVSTAIVLAALIVGLVFFRRMERTFADML